MKELQYRIISEYAAKHFWFEQFIVQGNKLATVCIYILYPALLCDLMFTRDGRFWRVFAVPAISFVLLSIFRHLLNAKRPYEVYDFTPVIRKDKKGGSFPSRHVFSAFVISMAGFYVNPLIGIMLTVISLFISAFRILGGVHFPKDVLVGAILGIFAGYLGFFVTF